MPYPPYPGMYGMCIIHNTVQSHPPLRLQRAHLVPITILDRHLRHATDLVTRVVKLILQLGIRSDDGLLGGPVPVPPTRLSSSSGHDARLDGGALVVALFDALQVKGPGVREAAVLLMRGAAAGGVGAAEAGFGGGRVVDAGEVGLGLAAAAVAVRGVYGGEGAEERTVCGDAGDDDLRCQLDRRSQSGTNFETGRVESGREGEPTPTLISMADQMTIASLFVYDLRFLMVKIRMIWITVTKNPRANKPMRTIYHHSESESINQHIQR